MKSHYTRLWTSLRCMMPWRRDVSKRRLDPLTVFLRFVSQTHLLDIVPTLLLPSKRSEYHSRLHNSHLAIGTIDTLHGHNPTHMSSICPHDPEPRSNKHLTESFDRPPKVIIIMFSSQREPLLMFHSNTFDSKIKQCFRTFPAESI
jgi:hypothetical protein